MPRLTSNHAFSTSPAPTTAVAHCSGPDALRGARSAADSHANHRPHDPEPGLWAGTHSGLHYIYDGGRETIRAVAARQLRRPGAQGGVAQRCAPHRPHAGAIVEHPLIAASLSSFLLRKITRRSLARLYASFSLGYGSKSILALSGTLDD